MLSFINIVNVIASHYFHHLTIIVGWYKTTLKVFHVDFLDYNNLSVLIYRFSGYFVRLGYSFNRYAQMKVID